MLESLAAASTKLLASIGSSLQDYFGKRRLESQFVLPTLAFFLGCLAVAMAILDPGAPRQWWKGLSLDLKLLVTVLAGLLFIVLVELSRQLITTVRRLYSGEWPSGWPANLLWQRLRKPFLAARTALDEEREALSRAEAQLNRAHRTLDSLAAGPRGREPSSRQLQYPVLKAPLAAYQLIESGDWEWKMLDKADQAVVASPDAMLGRYALAPLLAGQPIPADKLRPAPAIRYLDKSQRAVLTLPLRPAQAGPHLSPGAIVSLHLIARRDDKKAALFEDLLVLDRPDDKHVVVSISAGEVERLTRRLPHSFMAFAAAPQAPDTQATAIPVAGVDLTPGQLIGPEHVDWRPVDGPLAGDTLRGEQDVVGKIYWPEQLLHVYALRDVQPGAWLSLRFVWGRESLAAPRALVRQVQPSASGGLARLELALPDGLEAAQNAWQHGADCIVTLIDGEAGAAGAWPSLILEPAAGADLSARLSVAPGLRPVPTRGKAFRRADLRPLADPKWLTYLDDDDKPRPTSVYWLERSSQVEEQAPADDPIAAGDLLTVALAGPPGSAGPASFDGCYVHAVALGDQRKGYYLAVADAARFHRALREANAVRLSPYCQAPVLRGERKPGQLLLAQHLTAQRLRANSPELVGRARSEADVLRRYVQGSTALPACTPIPLDRLGATVPADWRLLRLELAGAGRPAGLSPWITIDADGLQPGMCVSVELSGGNKKLTIPEAVVCQVERAGAPHAAVKRLKLASAESLEEAKERWLQGAKALIEVTQRETAALSLTPAAGQESLSDRVRTDNRDLALGDLVSVEFSTGDGRTAQTLRAVITGLQRVADRPSELKRIDLAVLGRLGEAETLWSQGAVAAIAIVSTERNTLTLIAGSGAGDLAERVAIVDRQALRTGVLASVAMGSCGQALSWQAAFVQPIEDDKGELAALDVAVPKDKKRRAEQLWLSGAPVSLAVTHSDLAVQTRLAEMEQEIPRSLESFLGTFNQLLSASDPDENEIERRALAAERTAAKLKGLHDAVNSRPWESDPPLAGYSYQGARDILMRQLVLPFQEVADKQLALAQTVRAERQRNAGLALPDNLSDVRPTELGNVLAAAADYPQRTYGIDTATFLPRLLPELDPEDAAVKGLLRAQESLEMLLLFSFWSALWALLGGLALLIFGGAWWMFPLVVLGGSVLCWATKEGAVGQAYAYAEGLKAVFDRDRRKLFSAMGFAPAEAQGMTPEEERRYWRAFYQLYVYGNTEAQGLPPLKLKDGA